MKILEVKSLAIEEVKVIKYARFGDHRGYFTEIFNGGDFKKDPRLDFLSKVEFLQANESFSKKGTIRGLHFQWNPFMGKLVRTLRGRMIDLVLDIRKGSKTSGRIIAYDMPSRPEDEYGEWIWVPAGFAHGNVFPSETQIEYYCSGTWSPGCEAGISPFARDIDWSLCGKELKELFDEAAKSPLITDKDKNGFTVKSWAQDPRSDNFIK
ncbi:MAG: dTDP-4-dehydrorhamnose 3,5-epimerase family protein [Candidatus Margulisiibacteriota bacterium]